MNRYFNIGIVGSGKVADVLAPALENVGHKVIACYSAHESHATKLSERLYSCRVLQEPDFSDLPIHVLILMISDDALYYLPDDLLVPANTVVAHTSGSVPMEVLFACSEEAGILYPVQSFSKGRKIDLQKVPFCIEASTPTAETILYTLARAVSEEVYYLTSSQRKDVHIAAVFANNFVNHMLSIAWEYMHLHDLNTEILHALIQETVQKALLQDPRISQTGPARRGDSVTLDAHMARLESLPDVQHIYKSISASIQDFYRNKP
jgi:predicted short-subunit dehydrogenase-like oxidoreductase (DUF2520 family)